MPTTPRPAVPLYRCTPWMALLLWACQSAAADMAQELPPIGVPRPAQAQTAASAAEAVPQRAERTAQDSGSRINCCAHPPRTDPLDDPASPLAQRELFFAVGQFQLSPAAMALVDAHARYLLAHPQRRLRLVGHADARGTRARHRALARQRAEAVRRALMLMGVAHDRVEVLAMGSDTERARVQGPAAWARNRRVDLVYVR